MGDIKCHQTVQFIKKRLLFHFGKVFACPARYGMFANRKRPFPSACQRRNRPARERFRMKAEALFWQQCTQAVTDDGSIDAQRLMDLVIATYRSHESDYDKVERSAETLLEENRALRDR